MVFKKRHRVSPLQTDLQCVACANTFRISNRHSTGVLIDRQLSIKNLQTSARKILSFLGYPISTALPKRICQPCLSLTQQIVHNKMKVRETTKRLALAVQESGGSYLKHKLTSRETLFEAVGNLPMDEHMLTQEVTDFPETISPMDNGAEKAESGSGQKNIQASLGLTSSPSRKRKAPSPPLSPDPAKRACTEDQESVLNGSENTTSTHRTKASPKRHLFCRPSKGPVQQSFRGVAGAALYIEKGQYTTGIRQLYKKSKGFRRALLQVVPDLIRNEIAQIISSATAFKGEPTKENIESFSWDNHVQELQQYAPLLVGMLAGATTTKGKQKSLTKGRKRIRSVTPLIGSILSQLLFNKRQKEFNLPQKMNAMVLWLAGCKRKLFAQFNRLALCVGEECARESIDTLRSNFDNKVKVWKAAAEAALRQGVEGQEQDDRYGFTVTFDNVNQRTVSRHQHVNKRTEVDHNMVQAFAARDRVPTLHLDNTAPSPDTIRQLSISNVLPREEDIQELLKEMKVLVKRVLKEHMEEFNDAEVPKHIPHEFSLESSLKSEMVPLGVLEKDENKTGEMAECMDHYQQFVPRVDVDHLLTLLLYGDGLSWERAEAAQQIRSNSGTKVGRLEGLEPAGQEWHLRLLTLEDTFSELYASSSGKSKGTLFNLRNKFGFTGVSSDVKHKFAHCYEFLEMVTEAYIVLAARKIKEESTESLIIDQLTDAIIMQCFVKPNTHDIQDTAVPEDVDDFPYCICHEDWGGEMVKCQNKNCPDGKLFHCECIGMAENEIPNKWHCSIACSAEDHGANLLRKSKKTPGEPVIQDPQLDSVLEYSRAVIYRGLFLIAMRDAVKENDGPRMLLHWRFMMPQFYTWHHPKYFILGQKLLLSTAGGVSERLRCQLTWTRTVNGKGGAGNNMASDLKMEQFNRAYKVSCAASRGKLTPSTIERHSQMVGIAKELEGVYDTQVAGIETYASKRQKKANHDTDVAEIIDYLQNENLFSRVPGRNHTSFANYALFTGVRDKAAFMKRFCKHRENMARKIELRARRAARR